MSEGKPGRGSDQFPLRLPDGMRERIKAAADAAGRSMNAEIVATLEDRYPAPEELDAKVERMIFAIGARVTTAQTEADRSAARKEFLSLMATAGFNDQQATEWLERIQQS